MQLNMIAHAGDNEVFAPGCCDSSVGKTIPVSLPSGAQTFGVIESYAIIEDGKAVEIRIRIEK